jgi:exonuclease SbcC
MRPLSLELSGFRSYEDPTHISFEDRTLLAVVGPTGAGKSSLLDAISYALYGKTARIRRAVKLLICTRSDAAHVRLRFLVDDLPYEITRALPRTGAGEHVLTDESSGQRYVGAEEVTRRVGELLGLDFEAFCSSVLLAQGRFSVFLDAAPTDRIKVLKSVFRLEQIDGLRAAAKSRVGNLRLELAGIEGELRSIPDDAPELLDDARATAARAGARVEALTTALPTEKHLEDEARAADLDLATARDRVEFLTRQRGELPDRARLAALYDEEAMHSERLRRAEDALAAATAEWTATAARMSELTAEVGAERDLSAARTQAVSRRDIADEIELLALEMAERRSLVEELAAAVGAAEEAEQQALRRVQASRQEVLAARRAHAAHALRADLEPGGVCPVCDQEVAVVPSGTLPAALTDAERSESEAEAALHTARVQREDLGDRLSREQSACEHHSAALDRGEERIKLLDEQIEGVVGSHQDVLSEIEARLRLWDDAREAAARAGETRNTALIARDQCRQRAGEFASQRRDVAATLIAIAGRVARPGPRVDDSVAVLREHAAALEESLGAAAADAGGAARAAADRARSVVDGLRDLRVRLDLGAGTAIASGLATAAAELRVAEERADELEAKIARAAVLEAQRATLQGRHDVFDRLASDLTDRNFTHFLLEDRRRLLSELGSERLRAMTGRYRFDDAGNFNVTDELDGDKMREVSTLSGGETFLASLALALALAEAVQRAGGRLQCFFLDEGFGALDAESLDLALDGIERIVMPDRLIALVSHVQALAARIEDRIQLDRSPEGMSIVNSGAALG